MQTISLECNDRWHSNCKFETNHLNMYLQMGFAGSYQWTYTAHTPWEQASRGMHWMMRAPPFIHFIVDIDNAKVLPTAYTVNHQMCIFGSLTVTCVTLIRTPISRSSCLLRSPDFHHKNRNSVLWKHAWIVVARYATGCGCQFDTWH